MIGRLAVDITPDNVAQATIELCKGLTCTSTGRFIYYRFPIFAFCLAILFLVFSIITKGKKRVVFVLLAILFTLIFIIGLVLGWEEIQHII